MDNGRGIRKTLLALSKDRCWKFQHSLQSDARAVRRRSEDWGDQVAIKVIEKEAEDYFEQSDVIENEIAVLNRLPKHQNIIEFYEVVTSESETRNCRSRLPGFRGV